MKYFLIKYRFKSGSEEQWHRDIAAFISALDGDPALSGRITYRCMRAREGSGYYHLATAADDDAVKTLQSREFFSRYTEKTELAAGGDVEVIPLELIAQTVAIGVTGDPT
jgi:hypothetical protein